MSRDPSEDANDASASKPDSKRRADRASLIPTLSVLAVAIAAVATAFMATRPEPEVRAVASAPKPPQAVVRAPPLVVTAPPLKQSKPAPQARQPGGEPRGSANAMGSAPACEQCGVVETVLAAEKPGEGFQMRIRMDDGSVRMVEQRGALAAGTRVVVQGGAVRLPG